jgi:hypothetical protein
MHSTSGVPSPAADFLVKRQGASYAAKNFIQESGREKSWDSSSVKCKMRWPPLCRHPPCGRDMVAAHLVVAPMAVARWALHRLPILFSCHRSEPSKPKRPAPTRPQCLGAIMPGRRNGGATVKAARRDPIVVPRSWPGRSHTQPKASALARAERETALVEAGTERQRLPIVRTTVFPELDYHFRLQATAAGWNRLPRIELASLRRRCGRGP